MTGSALNLSVLVRFGIGIRRRGYCPHSGLVFDPKPKPNPTYCGNYYLTQPNPSSTLGNQKLYDNRHYKSHG